LKNEAFQVVSSESLFNRVAIDCNDIHYRLRQSAAGNYRT
jgi:hypothetical protein